LSLLGSTTASVILLLGLRAADARALAIAKPLFIFQFPGFVACASIWGLHSGDGDMIRVSLVWCAANAVAYWPVIFGVSYLFLRNGSRLRAP
jgi:hypothetical protein